MTHVIRGAPVLSDKKLHLRAAAVAVPLVLISAAWIWFVAARMRDEAIADANAHNRQLAKIFAGEVTESIHTIDLLLGRVIDQARKLGIQSKDELRREFGDEAAHDNLSRRLFHLPDVYMIAITDIDGEEIVNTRAFPVVKKNVAGLEPFEIVKRQPNDALAIGLGQPNLPDGAQTIFFARRLNAADGSPLGMVMVGVPPEYFIKLYDMLGDNRGASTSLFRTDGRLLAAYPRERSITNQIVGDGEWFKLAAAGGGTFRTGGKIAGTPKLMSLEPIVDAPLVINVGATETSILTQWRARATSFAIQNAAIASAIIALTCTLLFQFWKAQATQLDLARKSDELKSANTMFDAVISNMSQGIASFDARDNLLFHNPSYARMYRMTEADLPVGTHITKIWEMRVAREVFSEKGPTEYVAKSKRRLRESGQSFRTSIDHLTDGRYILISHQPTANGGFITTHVDITQRQTAIIEQHVQLEAIVQERTADIQQKTEELQVALVKQQAINEQQRSFVAMASHEFRTPLAIIDSSAQKLFRRAAHLTSSDIAERSDTIRRAVQRMTGLMESVLAMAKFDHGEIKASMRDGDLYQVVFDVCFRQMEMSDKHRLQFDLDALPRSARFDPALIDQVMTNLLANAVKFSPDAGMIDVRTSLRAGVARIEVEDKGVGIDPEDLPKLFKRYFRAKTSEGIAGTGIGLNVVKMIVDMHGGDIRVASVKGKGTIFTVELPIVDAGGAEAPAGGEATAALSKAA